MPSLKEHEAECVAKMGEPFTKVHLWLDEFFTALGPKYHRDVRHHDAGVEEARKLFGDRGAEAAKLHIEADYGGRVPTVREAMGRRYFSQGN